MSVQESIALGKKNLAPQYNNFKTEIKVQEK